MKYVKIEKQKKKILLIRPSPHITIEFIMCVIRGID